MIEGLVELFAQNVVDGKVVRRSFDRRHGHSPLHSVSAYAIERGLVLAWHAVDDKGGEPAALPAVLGGLCLAGCLVSLDAFDDTHGRLVRRRAFVCLDASCLATLRDWPGLATVLVTETIRSIDGTGVVTSEIRRYLGSSSAPPEMLAQAIRRHWAIKNGLH